MKRVIACVVLLLCATSVHARPSFRSIRENAESTNESEAGWRMKFFQWEKYGLRTTYAESWQEPLIVTEQKATDDRITYDYARLLPHDNELGQRKNYLLELTTLVWDVGRELSIDELEQFARTESPPRYNEYYVVNAFETTLAEYPAWDMRLSTMTGPREEQWISVGPYVYTIGYRARNDVYFEQDHFFYTDYLSSLKISPIPVTEQGNPPLEKEILFTDVAESHPYASAIAWAKNSGIISGYPDGTFGPERTVNRAEFVKVILQAAGASVSSTHSGFPDVASDSWYARYITTAKDLGIIQGYPDGTFKPEQSVNVAEALKMAYGAMKIETDASEGEWYRRYTDHAEANNILFGKTDPATDMKRQDIVWILWKLSQ